MLVVLSLERDGWACCSDVIPRSAGSHVAGKTCAFSIALDTHKGAWSQSLHPDLSDKLCDLLECAWNLQEIESEPPAC